MKTTRYLLLVLAFVLTAIIVSSCAEEATGPGFTDADFGINVIAQTDVLAPARGGQVDSVTILRAGIVIGIVKLEAVGSTRDFTVTESQVVELRLDGQAVAVPAVEVPPGTYKEVEISIDKLEVGNPAEEPLIEVHPEFADASVVIEGLVFSRDAGSDPFTFATDLDRDMEVDLVPFLTFPVSEDGQATAISIVVETGRWFLDENGAWLDPRKPANRSVIEGHIQKAFEAFEDANADSVADS